MAVLDRPELAATLSRLGVRTLGQFADLPVRHVLARFGADAQRCHRVARGQEGELDGLRDPALARRLRQVGPVAADGPRQPGFFGGPRPPTSGRPGPSPGSSSGWGPTPCRSAGWTAAGVPRTGAGWCRGGAGTAVGPRRATVAPWPGRVPPPSPVTVVTSPVPAELVDPAGRPSGVDGRGLLDGRAVTAVGRGRPVPEVAAWAGPWPLDERWWAARRRRARLSWWRPTGALPLAVEGARWWLEAIYD